ncbi:hypothetical protein NMY22_g9683 [Coprinellus aureogranulatus]|nr:hypothetical protein NMY22_g9683 [Coprinellus aureogranulatus]
MASIATLLGLPDELLTLILSELALDDILSIRVTCHALHRSSQSLQLWHHIFHRSLGQTIPEPFFLPKPLSQCSAHDIEHSLRMWDAPWLPDSVVQVIGRDVETASLDIPYFLSETLAMAPGGRWAVVGQTDGSIWYFDPPEDWTHTGQLVPHLLIPAPPTPDSTSTEFGGPADSSVTLSVDWASHEALGTSARVNFLTQFRIAVLAPQVRRNEPQCVDVWDVHVWDATHGPELRLGERLSSFKISLPDKLRQPRGCLYGTALSYNIFQSVAFVVDWRDANGRGTIDEPVLGRWIPRGPSMFSPITSIHLLPGNRILLSYEASRATFSLHNWERDYPLSRITDHHTAYSRVPNPVWQFESPSDPVFIASQHPFIIRDTIKMVLPTAGYVYGLTIQMDDYSLEGVRLHPLLKARFDDILPASFQLNRGVGFRDHPLKELYYAAYSWTGKHACSDHSDECKGAKSAFLVIDNPLRELRDNWETMGPGTCLFDLFSNRVIIPNSDVTKLYTVFATNFTAEGESAAPDRIAVEWEHSDDDAAYLVPNAIGGQPGYVYPGLWDRSEDELSDSEAGEGDFSTESDLEGDGVSIEEGPHHVPGAEKGEREEYPSKGLDAGTNPEAAFSGEGLELQLVEDEQLSDGGSRQKAHANAGLKDAGLVGVKLKNICLISVSPFILERGSHWAAFAD